MSHTPKIREEPGDNINSLCASGSLSTVAYFDLVLIVKRSLFSVLALLSFCICTGTLQWQRSKKEARIQCYQYGLLLSTYFSLPVICKRIRWDFARFLQAITEVYHLVQNLNGLFIPVSAIQKPFFSAEFEGGSSVLT